MGRIFVMLAKLSMGLWGYCNLFMYFIVLDTIILLWYCIWVLFEFFLLWGGFLHFLNVFWPANKKGIEEGEYEHEDCKNNKETNQNRWEHICVRSHFRESNIIVWDGYVGILFFFQDSLSLFYRVTLGRCMLIEGYVYKIYQWWITLPCAGFDSRNPRPCRYILGL